MQIKVQISTNILKTDFKHLKKLGIIWLSVYSISIIPFVILRGESMKKFPNSPLPFLFSFASPPKYIFFGNPQTYFSRQTPYLHWYSFSGLTTHIFFFPFFYKTPSTIFGV